MIVKIRIPRFASPGATLAATDLAIESPVRMGATFHAALTDSAEDWVVRGVPQTVFTPLPEVREAQPTPGMFARAWSWLHTKYTLTATKRLRVAETVSLGEKRFVSIVCVEGREFLIGGGASGVSLLARLDSGAQGDAQ
jgi:hypothetical protein